MIRVDDLTFAYTGAEKSAVRNLSFAIEIGEVFGFLGPSGAGKSTTQKILIGLLREFSGSVSVFTAIWRRGERTTTSVSACPSSSRITSSS